MGLIWSKLYDLFESFTAGNPARILMLGLDAAGKTTILYKVKLNENVTTIPTIGFNVETVTPSSGISFVVWDIGGQEKIRQLWKNYFAGSEGLVYIIDSADRARFAEAREELFDIVKHPDMLSVPVVVIANKQDLPNAASPSELIDCLQLHQLNHVTKWYVQGANAISGDGIYEAMGQLSKMVKERRRLK